MGNVVAGVAVGLVAFALLWGMHRWQRSIVRRNHEKYAAHPELRPYGKRLALRTSPFIALGIACCVYGVAIGHVVLALFGAVSAVLLTYEVVRRWHPPS